MVELLVVIVILSILAAILIGVGRYASWRIADAQSTVVKQQIEGALLEYRAVYGEYPIVGSVAHYSTNFIWATFANPFGFLAGGKPGCSGDILPVDLAKSCGYQYFDLAGAQQGGGARLGYYGFAWDARLAYPLFIAPLIATGTPIMQEKEGLYIKAAADVFWNAADADAAAYSTVEVRRPFIFDPKWGTQFGYVCTNGMAFEYFGERNNYWRAKASPITSGWDKAVYNLPDPNMVQG